jgi:anti-sigma factor RsiW
MKCTDLSDLMDDFVDGRLVPSVADAARAHIASCRGCARELEALRELRDRVARLPRDVAPPRDLWPGIAERIHGENVVRGRFVRRSLLAAAVVMIVFGAATAAYLLGHRSPRAVDAVPSIAAGAPGSVSASMAGLGVADYETTRGELLDALEARRHELSPETRRVLDENLQLIDDAMVRIADALREDPESELLMRQLAGAYRQQIGLLERAVRIPSDA